MSDLCAATSVAFTNRKVVRIEWGHCDPAGIIFYPRYFEIFNACTDALFEAAGFPLRDLVRDFGIVGYPMISTSAEFLSPSSFGDDLVIETSVTRWGRSSFDIAHLVTNHDRPALRGSEKRIWAQRDGSGVLAGVATPDHIVARMTGASA